MAGSVSRIRALLIGGTALIAAVPAAAGTQAETLDEALKEAARRSGREIIYPADVVRDRPAPAVDPDADAESAVRDLLRGTGLVAEFRPDVIVVRQLRSAPPASLTQEPAQGAEIVVTASRLRDGQTSSPVAVASRREIELSGVGDLGEFARRIPQNFAGGQNPGVTGGGNQGGNNNVNGSSNINLRGLGEDATLTLINGHRVAYDGLTQGIDISAIPIAAIERIEVVADSASALYGSDAVGGVVNVILRRAYDGLLTTARVGAALGGGYEQRQFNAVAGRSWGSGGLMIAGDVSRNTDITARQRDYTFLQDASATLFPMRRQASAVGAGHQRFGALTLGLDAQYSHRVSQTVSPFLTTASARVNGLIVRPTVDFHAVSPSLQADLPGGWAATISGTRSQSLSDLTSRRYAQSAETVLRLRYRNRLDAAEVGGEGPLVRLPGGIARLAVGAGLRALDLRVRNSSTAAGVTRITADYAGERDVVFGYGELSLPFVGPDNRSPLLEALRVDAAARYEKYDGLSGVLTPKLGLLYRPFDALTLKATWGRAFKAPTLQQENQIRQSALLPGSLFVGFPANRTVLLLAGGGVSLRPERAESWSATVELRPASSGFSASASFFDIRYRDRVTSPITSVVNALSDGRFGDLVTFNPTAAQLAEVIATLPQGLTNQTGRPYDPATVGAIIDNSLQNLAQQHVRGADLSIDYRGELEGGQKVGVNAAVTYLESDQRLSAGQARVERAGTIFDPPHWRGRLGVTWEHRDVTVAGFATYSGEARDDRFTPQGTVGSFVTVDASVRARSPAETGPFSGIEAGLSVLNLFDEEPSTIRNLNRADPPYDSSNSSVLGRSIVLTLSKAW